MINFFKILILDIRQRWVFAVMSFLALFNAFTMRSCLSITITEMTIPIREKEYHGYSCSYEDALTANTRSNTEYNASMYKNRYDWSEYQQVN